LFDGFGEDSVEDDCNNIGVIPDVHKFVGCVPIVGVDRSEARFEGGEQTFEILRAVPFAR
jgi:hypothetical protein